MQNDFTGVRSGRCKRAIPHLFSRVLGVAAGYLTEEFHDQHKCWLSFVYALNVILVI